MAELRGKLAKSEEARQKLRHSLVRQKSAAASRCGHTCMCLGGGGGGLCVRADSGRELHLTCIPPGDPLQGLLKEHAVNAQVAVEALKKTKAQLKEAEQAGEQARRQATQAQQALTEEQRRRLMAEQAAAAAKAAAAAAERQAQRAEAAASAAQSDAADVRRQLRQVQAQLARVQAACDSGAVAARQEAPAQQQQDVQSAAAAAALQEKVERLAAELDRWRAALGPLAALAGGSAHSGPSLAPPPAPAPAPARVASPQKQRRGRKPASAAAPGGAVERPTSPTGVQAAAAVAAAAPPQPPAEDARARAVRQVAARQAEAAAAAKRGPPAAAANVLAEALGSLEAGRPAKRAKQAAQQASQPQPAARPAVHALPAAPVAPAEPSLAVSASAPPGGHPHEHPAAADEAAQLLGSITAAASPGGPGISLEVVRRAAADLHFRLAEDRLPLLLLVRCFETAVLDGAASAPQGQLLQLPGDEDGQHQAGAAAAEASPDAWFGLGPLGPGSGGDSGEQQLRDTGHEQLRDPGEPPFAVVWCKREALAGRHLPWLLHCAAEIQRLHSARAAAAAALAAASEDSERPAGSGSGTGESFAAVLQQHMHREVLSWCLAAGSRAGSGGGLRHTETEACALAAVAAALCRMSGDVEVSWGKKSLGSLCICRALLLQMVQRFQIPLHSIDMHGVRRAQQAQHDPLSPQSHALPGAATVIPLSVPSFCRPSGRCCWTC